MAASSTAFFTLAASAVFTPCSFFAPDFGLSSAVDALLSSCVSELCFARPPRRLRGINGECFPFLVRSKKFHSIKRSEGRSNMILEKAFTCLCHSAQMATTENALFLKKKYCLQAHTHVFAPTEDALKDIVYRGTLISLPYR